MKKRTKERKLPKYAIANGLFIGSAPKVLQDLNPVELAMISPIRVLKRILSFRAGAHKSIKGMHTMVFNNDVAHTYRVLNYFQKKEQIDQQFTKPLNKKTGQISIHPGGLDNLDHNKVAKNSSRQQTKKAIKLRRHQLQIYICQIDL